MATHRFCARDEMPVSVRRSSALLDEAQAQLREARRQDKVLVLEPDRDERTASVLYRYQRAAKLLTIRLRVGYSGTRSYSSKTGRQNSEASVIYLEVLSDKPAAIAPAPSLAPSSGPLIDRVERRDAAAAADEQAGTTAPTTTLQELLHSTPEQRHAAREALRRAEYDAERQHDLDALTNRRTPSAGPPPEQRVVRQRRRSEPADDANGAGSDQEDHAVPNSLQQTTQGIWER